MYKRLLYTLLAGIILFTVRPASAQTPTPPAGPVYVVQEGDTLWDIATRFNLTVEELMAANGLTNPDELYVGVQLVIPGLEGISGVLTTEVVPFGDTLRSLSRRMQVPSAMLRKLNRLISPTELYAGVSLIIPQQEGRPALIGRASPASGQTLLELAVQQGTDAWVLAQVNGLTGTWAALPGDVLYSPAGDPNQSASGLPAAFASAEAPNLPLKQGGTAEIRVSLSQSATLSGMLADYPLHFFPMSDGGYAALQGVHAMLEPGVYPLRLEAALPDGSVQSFEQMVLVKSGGYQRDPKLTVEPSTIDPAVTEPENDQIKSIVTPATAERHWNDMFRIPVDLPYCIKSWYGNRRSYNNSDYIYFHTGVDYGVCATTHPFDIYSPAAGVVVYTDALTVRGNATIIDHGWGIYSGFWHQAEIYVEQGQRVEAGELIGQIGKTGRVTGPHLHWELWVNGVQVNPLDWLEQAYPQQ